MTLDLDSLRRTYRATLLEDVIPFWERHAVDPDGALNTCIADDGTVTSRDRWGWSQWRAVWVFSRLYNSVDARPRWLQIARDICQYVSSHGPLEDGHWPLLLDGSGRVRRGFESIYVDGFALYGLVELWRATREPRLLELAHRTFRAVEDSLRAGGPPPSWPYPMPPGTQAHGVSMMFSLVYHELAVATGDPEVRAAADRHHRKVMLTFHHRGRNVVLERLRADGSELPAPQGTAVVPGHAIESMWFQILIARERGDSATIRRAVDAIRRHLELGWDDEHGGLFLAVDADGGAPDWAFADTKLWWPHTESLLATLMAYEEVREPWCLEWHERVRRYSYERYPVARHGEWRQKLDRRGNPITDVVALPVKDPFHLPRALMGCVEVLDRLVSPATAR
jgi:N-acylglucosamine 2-epimerase